MNAAEEGPVVWLRAQVEARKAAAIEAADGDSGHWFMGDKWNVYRAEDIAPGEEADEHDLVVYGNVKPQSEHIALNDPQDTIAQCEAELAILDEHRAADGACPGEVCCITCGDYPQVPYPCRTVRLLASGYKWRPGYREQDWKP